MKPIAPQYDPSVRLSDEAFLDLAAHAELFTLGAAAYARRQAKHPGNVVTYIVDRNVNYTNVCSCGCKFCAFFKAPEDEGGYVLSLDELLAKVAETFSLGGRQILLQGGMHPELKLSWYTDTLRALKAAYPEVAIHGFSPPEIHYLAQITGLSVAEIVSELKAAGLSSLPGGGAEILTNEVRARIAPRKCDADAWIEVMRQAHRVGLRSTATMMFGVQETWEDRLEHLRRLRDLQDETGGFTAFIPWSFQPGNTRLPMPEASSVEYLRMLALSRLYLDNIDNIQASWVTQGEKIGELALFFGANDFGSTMIEENVVAAAGVSFRLPEAKLRRIVCKAGFTPRRRQMDYTLAAEPTEQELAFGANV